MKISGIYKITSPSGKVYVGQAVDIEKRFSHYLKLKNCKNQSKLYSSLVHYGVENHKFEVIHELPCDVEFCILDAYEILYISQYKSNFNKYPFENGLNLTDGGGGTKGFKHSDESKTKIGKASKGNKYAVGVIFSEERKKQISDFFKGKPGGMLGKTQSKETRKLMSTIQTERQSSDSFKNKMSEKIKNSEAHKAYREEYIQKVKSGNFHLDSSKPVLQFDKVGMFINEYPSIKDAIINIKGNINCIGNISCCCKGTRNLAYGFKWKYKEN